jgi:hypothetical protein
VTNMHGLNSPTEVFFFSKTPEAYELPTGYYNYEITRATIQTMDNAKAKTRSSTRLEIVHFGTPSVDVQGKKYMYVVRSNASRDHFKNVMSPEYLRNAKGVGIQGLHYSASETPGDAIGITVEADTPQAAKERFHAWYTKVKESLNALDQGFAVINKEVEQKIEQFAAERLEELNRAKDAL